MTSKQRQRANRKLAKRRTFLESLEPRYVLTGYLSLDITNIGSVDESNTAYEITATRTHFDGADVSQGVSVAFSISLPSMWYPNQATLNEDYTLSSQEFSFAPGEDQAKITLTLIDDNVDEPAELITFINFDPDTMGISEATFVMEIKASDPKANVANVSDPDCCGADSTSSYTDNNLETGNSVVRPPRTSLAMNDFGPRYSTNEFRPGIYSAETTRRQSPNAPVSIEVNGVFYDPTGVGLNQPYRFSELVDISSLPAGRYDDSLEITEHYASGPSKTYEIPTAILVGGPSNARLSPGWSIPALDRITVTGSGALWQSKSDQLLWFPLDSGNFLRPYGDQDYTTLVDNQDGTQRREPFLSGRGEVACVMDLRFGGAEEDGRTGGGIGPFLAGVVAAGLVDALVSVAGCCGQAFGK